jgi:hypothetical protein
LKYIVLIIAIALAGFVGGCDLNAMQYGAEKLDPGITYEHARYYHMGTFDVTTWEDPESGREYTWNTVELEKNPGIRRMCAASTFDGPFGSDALLYSDSDRRVAYNNCYFPNKWWDAGSSKFHGDDPDCSKPAFDGHIDL